jgi:hypothetical protein
MTTIELTKSGIAMKKLGATPENSLNERRKDVLRYVEKRGSWPYLSKLEEVWIHRLRRS